MNTISRFAAAAVLLTAFAGAAQAQDAGPYVIGTGENASVRYNMPSQNVVGGALVRTIGSGEGAQTEVIAVDHAQRAHPVARVVNSGDSLDIIYQNAATRLARGGLRG